MGFSMAKLHKEILGLMGKIDIDCRDEKDNISSILPGSRIYITHLTKVASSMLISGGDSKNLS